MGGAQAGEVASEMAVESFDRGLPDGAPAEALVQVIEDANRRIHDRSRAESQRAGMGTTVTAAYVGEQEVTIAHVGDSRAYLLRDGRLERLTRDHSLVGELVARGKLTEEQAETHPQRSVITRALGPEPDVQVDVRRYQARDGDVFLVCSDGLTSMVRGGARHGDPRGRRLARARRPRADRGRERRGRPRQHHRGPVPLEEVEGGEEPVAARAGDVGGRRAAEGRPRATMAVAKPRRQADRGAAAAAPAPAGRAAPRRAAAFRVGVDRLLVVLLIVGAGLWTASRAVYFVGVDDQGTVTVYQGLPYELPFGIELYDRFYTSGVTLAQVAEDRRATFTDHELRSKDDAEDLVRQLERAEVQ